MLLRIVLSPLRLFVKEITGLHNIPKGPFILASNHASYIDAPLLTWLLGTQRKKIRFFATNNPKWKTPFWNFWFNYVGAIRINGSLDKGLQALKQGDNLGIFPEGERSVNGKIHSSEHKGLGVLALKARVPILPVYINTFWWWNRHMRMPNFKRNIIIHIGKPQHHTGKYSDKRAHAIVKNTMNTIRRLK